MRYSTFKLRNEQKNLWQERASWNRQVLNEIQREKWNGTLMAGGLIHRRCSWISDITLRFSFDMGESQGRHSIFRSLSSVWRYSCFVIYIFEYIQNIYILNSSLLGLCAISILIINYSLLFMALDHFLTCAIWSNCVKNFITQKIILVPKYVWQTQARFCEDEGVWG